ncbi:P-loop containing nucleoside triphosphate hydrolase [Phytophthora cactorum]|nr:P-loop containing nucleoside triphosphate hydrolase [Phytophthora cactorum]
MSWKACARSGDATSALLQPYQVLISHEDATLHSIKQLDLVCVHFASHSSVLLVLECVIDRRQSSKASSASAMLCGGRIQLHPWVLVVCRQLEDTFATLEKVELARFTSIWLSLQTKFPSVATSGSDSVGLELGDSRVGLLPESVRKRQIDLEAVIRRQVRAAGTLRAPQIGQLVPVRLLGDTGGGTAELTEQVAALSVEEKNSGRTTDASYESELNARMWQTGFAGYTTFVQDVLLNLALVLKRGQKRLENDVEMEQIASTREDWNVATDGMSLLMGAESPTFPTTYEYLTHELEQRFPELGSLCGHEPIKLVLIDDLDALFQSADGQTADGSNTQLPHLAARCCRTGRFGKVLDLVVPTEQSRREILRRHLIGLPLRTEEDSLTDSNAESLASRLAVLTGGYVAKDLVRICRNAAARAHAESVHDGGSMNPSVGWTELLQAQQQVKPSQLRELNVASPGAPKQLFDFVSWKFHPTAAMNRLGISNASGILLSGPSGCGKTLLVQTLAAQAKVNFVSVKSSELLSKYFGDSEKAVRQLFARARAASPCLLFFDEFDSIAHKRSFGEGDGGSSGGGVYARVLSTFLNEMDGVGSQRVTASSVSHTEESSIADSGGILVVAATNRKDALDAALVRPGRIDKTVEIGFPTHEDVEDILALYTRKMPLADDVNIQELAARPRGSCTFTGADIAAVCKEAAFRALREDIDSKTVRFRHFEAAWDQRAEATPTYTTPSRTNQDSTDV